MTDASRPAADPAGAAPAADPAGAAPAGAPVAPTVDADRQADRPGRDPGELVVAMSPRQILGGFALLAGLIIMLRRRSRGRGKD